MEEDLDLLVAFRLFIFDKKYLKVNEELSNKKNGVVEHAWVPQTEWDQVWALFKFANREDKEKWVSSLSEEARSCIEEKSDFKKDILSYGFHVRDANWFY